jgi:formyltetrahydrofolate deformylase
MSPRRYILSLVCTDRVGIVAAVSSFLARHSMWIVEAQHHADPDSKLFFMRNEVLAESSPFDLPELRRQFEPIRGQFQMRCTINDSDVPKRVVILVSRQTHCLDDLLYRLRSGEMSFDLRAVISNHEDSRAFVEWHKVPFHHVPVASADKETAFRAMDSIIERCQADVIVLARYMQIIPPWMCEKYPYRIINIHHSFLPSFVGGQPYHQAYQRGVKYVGATCHYVTQKLDDGPIIEQDAFRTNHADSIEELIRVGRDIEKAVLARGLRYHLEDRVLLNGNRTVVFA